MKYNPILDSPPETFGGVKLKTDFRAVLEYIRIAQNPNIDDEEKAFAIIQCFFEEMPKYDIEKIGAFIEWYLTRGEEAKGGGGKKVFCWTTDAGRVFAAFLQVYKIDLSDKSVKFHWWNFKELFEALPNGTKLSDVIDIRSQEIKVKDTKENRIRIAKLQAQYAIQRDYNDIET